MFEEDGKYEPKSQKMMQGSVLHFRSHLLVTLQHLSDCLYLAYLVDAEWKLLDNMLLQCCWICALQVAFFHLSWFSHVMLSLTLLCYFNLENGQKQISV